MEDFRKTGDPKQFGALIGWLRKARPNGVDLTSGWTPAAAKAIAATFRFDPAGLDRELQWAVAVFRNYSTEIEEALRVVRQIEDAILAGDPDLALTHLDSLESLVGTSMWSIEVRITLLQSGFGLTAQKDYTTAIVSESSAVVGVFTHYTSQRNEDQMSLARFEANIARQLRDYVGPSGTYLRYRLLHRVNIEEDEFSTILNLESQAGLFDYYETFVSLAQRAALNNCPQRVAAPLIDSLRRLCHQLDDPRLRRSLYFLGDGDKWLEGAWEPAGSDEAESGGRGYQDDVEAWRLASEGLVFDDRMTQPPLESALAAHAVAALRSLTDFPDLADEVAASQRMAANLRGLQLGRALQVALSEQYASTTEELQTCRAAASMHSRYLWPTHLLGCRTRAQLAALTHTLAADPVPQPFIEAALSELGSECPESPVEALAALQSAVEALIDGSYEPPIEQPQDREVDRSTHARSRIALRLACSALLDRNETDEVVRLLAANAALNRNIGILPISQTVAQIDQATIRRLSNDISLSIVFDLYVRYISPELEDERAYAFEDLLAARGVDTPSQLRDTVEPSESNLLQYLLRHLAVPDVMEAFTVFESTQDLEDERVRVLSVLISLDPSGADAYEAEAKDITRNQAIQRGMRQVEMSKIYVDLVRVRKALERELQDDFARYMSLPHLPFSESRQNLLEVLRIALSPHHGALPEIPKDEASLLLVEMLIHAFNELTLNKEHGLDCYLSMRIRHGALSGQLRTPMERQRLITQLSTDGSTYQPNTNWPDLSSALSDRMDLLSSDYDRLVDELARERVQVRSAEKPDGWFELNARQSHLYKLMASIKSETTFEDFLDFLFELYLDELAVQLERVRAEIELVVKPALLETIGSLERDMLTMTDSTTPPALNVALATARVGVQQALDVVKDWFQLPQSERNQHQFDMDELVQIGLKCVQALHVDYHPELRTDIGDVDTLLNPLVVFTDIFVILFENARVHSGSSAPRISVSISQSSDTIYLQVENTVTGAPDQGRLEKIAEIRDRIQSGAYIDSVAKEGGSGLIKLQRIASSLDESATIRFGLERKKFWTSVPIRVVRFT